METDGVPLEHRQGVEELVGLLYADTPLQKIFRRACELARKALNAQAVFLRTQTSDGTVIAQAPDPPDEAPQRDIDALIENASTWNEPATNDAFAGMAVPIRHGESALGAFGAIDTRRTAFGERDADLLEVYANYIAIAQSNYTAVGQWLRRLKAQRRARRLVVVVALVLSVALAGYGWFTARLATTQIAENAHQAADASSDRFVRFVAIASQLASTTAALAPAERGNRSGTERLLRSLLRSARSDVVYGIGVWYQPYKFSPRTRLFGPYAHRVENNGITLTYVWSSGSYNYPSHAWYRTGAQTSTETRITPPYFDVDHVYISAVHGMFVNGAFAGVTTTDMTSESIDTFLQAISSRRHVLYVTDLSGRVVAFPNTAALIAFARARHPVRRILDVTDADARAFLRMHYGKDTVLLQRRATPMPLVLVDAWDPATLGPAVPLSLLIAIGVLLWVAAAAAMILLWHTRVNTQHTLNVHREHSRLLMEIESHVRAERALRRAAEVDRMTGLSDRATFMRDLERRVTSPPDAASSTALLLLDVNNLDALNEAYGRQTGDRVLMHVAALARRCCGRYDVAARFESDQFAVLVSGDAERRGRAIADCVQRGMSAGLEVDGQRLFFDSAAGFVTVGPEHAHAQDVLRDADDALYYAKRTGHAFVEFTQQLREEAHRDREMRAALRGALERGEMYCVYQPIYRLDTRAVVGLEALARWQRGETTVYPAQFIPLAERTGLVLEVDRYIAETATKVVSQLRDGVPIALSINVSALHFKHRAAFEALQTSLERGRLGHGMLNVELTETALMTLSSTSRDFVQQIHALGVGMHLDDFGTGYSSLSYLQHLHVDALKIDRSFVAAMLGDERARQIVELIVQLARRFRIETIAEGIESAAQEDALRDLGVTMGQGLFFAAPVRARDLPDILGAVHRK